MSYLLCYVSVQKIFYQIIYKPILWSKFTVCLSVFNKIFQKLKVRLYSEACCRSRVRVPQSYRTNSQTKTKYFVISHFNFSEFVSFHIKDILLENLGSIKNCRLHFISLLWKKVHESIFQFGSKLVSFVEDFSRIFCQEIGPKLSLVDKEQSYLSCLCVRLTFITTKT